MSRAQMGFGYICLRCNKWLKSIETLLAHRRRFHVRGRKPKGLRRKKT